MEVLRPDRRRGDDAEDLRLLGPEIVEPVHRAARNAQRLSGPDLDRVAVHRPRQHAGDAVDRLLVVVVAVGRRHQALRRADGELEGGNAAGGLIRGDQEADRQRPEVDAFLGGIDGQGVRVSGHASSSSKLSLPFQMVNSVY